MPQQRARSRRRRIGWAVLVGALALAVAYNGMVLALTSSVAASVFILSAAPLLAGLLGWLALGERLQAATLGAAAFINPNQSILTRVIGKYRRRTCRFDSRFRLSR